MEKLFLETRKTVNWSSGKGRPRKVTLTIFVKPFPFRLFEVSASKSAAISHMRDILLQEVAWRNQLRYSTCLIFCCRKLREEISCNIPYAWYSAAWSCLKKSAAMFHMLDILLHEVAWRNQLRYSTCLLFCCRKLREEISCDIPPAWYSAAGSCVKKSAAISHMLDILLQEVAWRNQLRYPTCLIFCCRKLREDPAWSSLLTCSLEVRFKLDTWLWKWFYSFMTIKWLFLKIFGGILKVY